MQMCFVYSAEDDVHLIAEFTDNEEFRTELKSSKLEVPDEWTPMSEHKIIAADDDDVWCDAKEFFEHTGFPNTYVFDDSNENEAVAEPPYYEDDDFFYED